MRALSVVSSIISSLSFLSFSADIATLSQLSDESRLAQSDFPAGILRGSAFPRQNIDWRTDEVGNWFRRLRCGPNPVSTIFDGDGHI
jgi:hypothetical protein